VREDKQSGCAGTDVEVRRREAKVAVDLKRLYFASQGKADVDVVDGQIGRRIVVCILYLGGTKANV
jgi:hypothetical protein